MARSIGGPDRSRATLTKKHRRRTMGTHWKTLSDARVSWVERASLFLTTDNSLIQCDCCKVGSMIAATHQRPPLLVPFATSRARKNHTNVLPRTCRSVTFTHSPPRARYSIAFQFLRTCISLICYSNNNARITILKETSLESL